MDYEHLRARMVKEQILARGISDKNVLRAMKKVPRHFFMPEGTREEAYGDHPVPIGEGQTISQPYIVAYMTEELGIGPESRVLEIGLGSGYQAAVLAEIASEVYSVERISSLAERAEKTLKELGYDNVRILTKDGYSGWQEEAPFDGIIVTAAPPELPKQLLQQLAPGGVLVAPVGSGFAQELVKVVLKGDDLEIEKLIPVRFVPMISSGEK